MASGKRKVPDINSSSTADIAFLLLIFFLITTSMDTDRGLARRLPQPPEKDAPEPDKIKERNILTVYLNKDDQLMCGSDYIQVSELKDRAKAFVQNAGNEEGKPEKIQKTIEFFGPTMITDKHVISLQNDRGSSYQAYISVQNELVAAYNELRNELAQQKWQVDYSELDEDQQRAIRDIYPQRISEAEPKKYGEKKK